MDQRIQFIADYLSGLYTKKDLCRHDGISRPTGDKWIERLSQPRIRGAPGPFTKTPPAPPRHRTRGRRAHRADEARASKLWTQEGHGPPPCPGAQAALASRQHRSRHPQAQRLGTATAKTPPRPPDPRALVACSAPAQSWSADFKGDFRLEGGQRCYPLTLSDNHSRFILQCRALNRMTTGAVKPWFEWAFREYGLPDALRNTPAHARATTSLASIGGTCRPYSRKSADTTQ